MSIELGMPSNHLILCRPLLLVPSIFPSIRVFFNNSALRIRWPKYWSFSFSISPSNEYSGLISFRMDWLDLLAAQVEHVLHYVCAKTLHHVWSFATLWTIAHLALSMGFSRQESWSGVPFPTPAIFPTKGSNLRLLHLLHWQVGSLPLSPPGEPVNITLVCNEKLECLSLLHYLLHCSGLQPNVQKSLRYACMCYVKTSDR